jgi:hypothetical protein
MTDIRHRMGTTAKASAMYELLATREGIAQWWTRDTRGASSVGDKLEFWFGHSQPSAIMEVTELTPSRRVAWRVLDGPDGWVDTTITFDIREQDGEAIVVFTHAGWPEPTEFLHHCSTSWAYFLLSMKHALEGGAATPWPDNERISTWG